MYEKELWILEEKLQKIKNELNKFAEQIPNQLGNDIKNFETNIIKKRSQYIKTMQGIDWFPANNAQVLDSRCKFRLKLMRND